MVDQSAGEGKMHCKALQYPGTEALTTISTYPYLSVLLDHLIRPWTKEEVEVQYPTNSAIRDGRVGLQLDLWGRGEIPWHVSVMD